MQPDRTCRTCGKAKPRSEYYINAKLRDGLQRECKTCWKTRAARNKRAAAARRDARRARIQAKLDDLGLKVCGRCRWLKLLDDFHRDQSRRDGLTPYCKPCNRASARASVAKHGRKPTVSHKRDAAREYVHALKAAPCVDCGMTWPPKAMHFHHLDPALKTARVSELVSRGASRDELDAEIEKCVLLCANCHVVRHE